MSLVTIDTKSCAREGLCIASCPIGCLAADDQGYPVAVEGIGCIKCGHCVAICPHQALVNEHLRIEDFTPSAASGIDAAAMSMLLKTRRSVREYRKKPLSDEELNALIEVGRYAPTASNTQLVSYVSIERREVLDEVKTATMDWLVGMTERPHLKDLIVLWEKGEDVVLRGAPNLLLACAPERYKWNAVDCTIAMTYIELQAAAMGLGACWGGLVMAAIESNPELGKRLGIDPELKACAALMLGHPRVPYPLIPPRNPAKLIRI